MNARKLAFPPYPAWTWHVPQFFNIGVACTDAHLETEVASRLAMIVEDDARGTVTASYRELAERSSQFSQVLRKHGVVAGERVLVRLPNSLEYPIAFFWHDESRSDRRANVNASDT